MKFHFSPAFPVPGVCGRKGWWVYLNTGQSYPMFLGVVTKSYEGFRYTLHTQSYKSPWASDAYKSRGRLKARCDQLDEELVDTKQKLSEEIAQLEAFNEKLLLDPRTANCEGCGLLVHADDAKTWQRIDDVSGELWFCPRCHDGEAKR